MTIVVTEKRTYKVPRLLHADFKAALAQEDTQLVHEMVGDLDDHGECVTQEILAVTEKVPGGAKVQEKPKAQPKPSGAKVFLCLGPHAWGKGFTETGALREAERAGGHKLRKSERVFYTCTDPWVWVDDMGMIRYADGAVVRRHKEGVKR